MKLQFNTPKGHGKRRKKQMPVYILKKDGSMKSYKVWIWISGPPEYVYLEKEHKWVCDENGIGFGKEWSSSCKPPSSVKAFVRLLKKWSKYLPPNLEFTLASRFDILEVIGKTAVYNKIRNQSLGFQSEKSNNPI
jgi:hypothetical protein